MVTSSLRWFKPIEFEQASPSCHIEQMDLRLLEMLDDLREAVGFPLVINSAYRTKEYDLLRGRTGCGYHTLGRAVDIACTDASKRAWIVAKAIEVGFKGIGVASTYIHLDNRSDFKLWTY